MVRIAISRVMVNEMVMRIAMAREMVVRIAISRMMVNEMVIENGNGEGDGREDSDIKSDGK